MEDRISDFGSPSLIDQPNYILGVSIDLGEPFHGLKLFLNYLSIENVILLCSGTLVLQRSVDSVGQCFLDLRGLSIAISSKIIWKEFCFCSTYETVSLRKNLKSENLKLFSDNLSTIHGRLFTFLRSILALSHLI